MALVKKLPLAALCVCLAMFGSPTAEAHGAWSHIHVTGWAIEGAATGPHAGAEGGVAPRRPRQGRQRLHLVALRTQSPTSQDDKIR